MYRNREESRGIPLGKGRGGYSGRSGYSERYEDRERYENERYDMSRYDKDRSYERGREEDRGRGRRYDRPRSRSPGRRHRSRSRSRSRDRLYRERYYRKSRSRTPPRRDRGAPENEGLRITIRPRYEEIQRHSRSSNKYKSRHTKRHSRSHSRSSSSGSFSKSRSKSPNVGRAKESPTGCQSPDESLRITVGNDRYLQMKKHSAVARLGPPVEKRLPRERNNPSEEDDRETREIKSPVDIMKRNQHLVNHDNLPFLGRTPHEDDLYASKNDADVKDIPKKEEHSLPLIPGVVSTLEIDDEDKFLYGEDDDSPAKKDQSPRKGMQPDVGLSEYELGYRESKGDRLSHINQYGDQDYRMQSSGRRNLTTNSEGGCRMDNYRDEHSVEQELYGQTVDVNQQVTEADSYQKYRDRDYLRSPNRFATRQEQYDPSPTHKYAGNKSDGDDKSLSTHTEKPDVESTLENILKSIGFNFELSKLIQERAQKEREEQHKKESSEYGNKARSLHSNSGKKDTDLVMSYDDPGQYEGMKRGSKRTFIGTAETYEQMAKKYREEQERAYENEERKRNSGSMHPLDYLTRRGEVFMRKGSSEYNAEQSVSKRERNYDGYDVKSKETEDIGRPFERGSYRNKEDRPICEDPWNVVKHDGAQQTYTTYSQEKHSSSRSRSEDKMAAFSQQDDDDRFERRPITLYAGSNRIDSPKRHSRSKSPRDGRYDVIEAKRYETKRSVSPPKRLAEDDLRNVLIASDKASKRTVLPPKAERDRLQQVHSPMKDPTPEKRAPPVLSAKERERLEKEKEEGRKKLVILENELDKLRKQQGDMMRRKQRQKDGHKDPLLVENSELQEEITKQISMLRKAVETQPPSEDGKDQAKAIKFKMEKKAKVDLKVQAVLADSSDEDESKKKKVPTATLR